MVGLDAVVLDTHRSLNTNAISKGNKSKSVPDVEHAIFNNEIRRFWKIACNWVWKFLPRECAISDESVSEHW